MSGIEQGALNKQNFISGYCIDNQDPLMLGRIRVQLEAANREEFISSSKDFDENSTTPDVNGPWSPKDPFVCLPLLPYYLNITPGNDELVLVFLEYGDNLKTRNKFYISGILSSPVNVKGENFEKSKTHFDSGTRIPRPQNIKNNLSQDNRNDNEGTGRGNPKTTNEKNDNNNGFSNPRTKGVFPEPADNALLGRGSADIIVKENEVLLRTGKAVKIDNDTLPEASGKRGFIQLTKFDFSTTLGPKQLRYRLQRQDKNIKFLIEYDIYNPENTQDVFQGDVTLYSLPKKESYTNTANFDIDTPINPSSTPIKYKLQFNNKTSTEVITLVNDFIKGFQNGTINGEETISNQFPFYFRPKKRILDVINNITESTNIQSTKNVGLIYNGIKIRQGDTTPGYSLVYNLEGDDTVPFEKIKDEFTPIITTPTDETQLLMGAKKVFLLSNESTIPGKKRVKLSADEVYGITLDTITNDIEPNTSSLVRGEELMELLNLIVKFLITHVHPFPGLPPVGVSLDGTSSQDILKSILEAHQKILNGNIRIN